MREIFCPDRAGEARPGLLSTYYRDAARRIAFLGAAFIVISLLNLSLTYLFYDFLGWPVPEGLGRLRMTQVGILLLSGGIHWLARTNLLNPRRLLDVALIYQVGGAALISIPAYYGEVMLQEVMQSFSWLALWILLLPVAAPTCPRKNLLAALLCATMAPLVFLTWIAVEGRPLPRVSVLVTSFLPNYLCAGIAMVPVLIILRLGESASLARSEARALGSYELLERLGAGGMGEVWSARHRMLARPAAVKLIKAGREPISQEQRTRFEREARTTSRLGCPHTVTLYEFGITEDGTFFYAMELLRGMDLDSLVRRFGPQPPARVSYLLLQACESLAEAHQEGLVHRDIKPANLVICQLGVRYDFLKVLDFGLVSCIPKRGGQDPRLTQAGAVVGTPAFMAPEQARGSQAVDHRADIYSLGCVAYWLLTSRLVFEQPTGFKMLVDHMKTPPEAPSQRTRQSIPPELEGLVMRCLQKDPNLRPQSAAALASELRNLRANWSQRKARAWWQKRSRRAIPVRTPGDQRLEPEAVEGNAPTDTSAPVVLQQRARRDAH